MDRARRTVCSAVVLAALSLGLSGCGESTPAVCDSVDQLRTSLKSLQDVKIQQGALDDLTSRLKEVQSDLDKVKSDAASEFSDEVDAVQGAGKALKTGVDAAVATPSAATISALRPEVQALVDAVGKLEDALAGTC